MEQPQELQVTKRRLSRALSVAEKLKKTSMLESEVSKELARRNEVIRKEAQSCEERLQAAKYSITSLEHCMKHLSCLIDDVVKDCSMNSSDKSRDVVNDLHASRLNCLDMLQSMKFSLYTTEELKAEIIKAEKLATNLETENHRQEEVQLTEALEPSNDPRDHDHVEVVMAETAFHDQHEDNTGSGGPRSRTESTSSATRGRTSSMSAMKNRRNSSIFVQLPTNTGTSLIRKSADALPSIQTLNQGVTIASGDETEIGASGSESIQGDVVASIVPTAATASASMKSLDETNLDCSLDLNVSQYPTHLNDTVLLEDPAEVSNVALFEHFIVVGASEEVAIEFAHQLQCSYDEGTLSSMFKNTFGNLFTSNRFGQALTPPPGQIANISTSSSTVTTHNHVTANKQSSVPTGGNKSAEVSAGGNSRRSFGVGRGGANAASAPVPAAAATTISTPAPTGPDTTTPVRTGGVFSYFMRSPPPTAGADAAVPVTADKLRSAVKTPSPLTPPGSRVKTTDVDSLLDFDAVVEQGEEDGVHAQPTRAPRKFIYGDDNSSDNGGSDVMSAGELSPVRGNSIKLSRSMSNRSITPTRALTPPEGLSATSADSELDQPPPVLPLQPASPLRRVSDGENTLLDFDQELDLSSPAQPPPPPPQDPSTSPNSATFSSRLGDAMSAAFYSSSSTGTQNDQQISSTNAEIAENSESTLGYLFGTSPSKITRKGIDVPTSAAAEAVGSKPPHMAAEDVFTRGRQRSREILPVGSPMSPNQMHRGSHSSTGGTNHALPGSAYVPNTKAAELIAQADKKLGFATTKAEILYRYPPTVEPPPQEVSDFCMPLGGKIAKLSDFDSGTTVQEILFGHSHSKRSSRCFIFLLEDKTLSDDSSGDEETGVGNNRLYGICVLHPRLIKTPIQNTKRKNPLERNQPHTSAMDASMHGSYNGTAGLVAESEFIEFESVVCYAFLTRFPLFDFFFQVIFDLINTERLTRLELAAEHSDSDLLYSRSVYEYLPVHVLEEVLARLTKLPPPSYGQKFQFNLSPGIKPIESIRVAPPPDFSEHYMNSSEWALPTLLSWMPVETIVWAMSLLLGEAKIVVVGHDYGMVSCAVIGLLVLLRPLDWVSPVIPMLPIKLMDFVESPVPILVGITVSSKDQTVTVEKIFDRCSDPSNEGLHLAVLDVSKRELYMSVEDKPQIPHLCMPGADILATKIKECLSERNTTGAVVISSIGHSTPRAGAKPIYTASLVQRAKTRAAHDVMSKHISHVADLAMAHQRKINDRQRLVVELADRMTAQFGNSSVFNKAGGGAYSSDPFEEGDDDDLEEGDDDDGIPISGGGGTSSALVALGIGGVLRPRGATTGSNDAEPLDRNFSSHSAPGGSSSGNGSATQRKMSMKMPQMNVNAIQALGQSQGPPLSSKLVCMSKQTLKGHNRDDFLDRFVRTQIFAEHLHRQTAVETSASVVPASGGNNRHQNQPPLATAVVASKAQYGSPTVLAGGAPAGVTLRRPSSPEPVSRSGSETAPAVATGGASGLGLIETSPRNSLILRRRSVDMGYLMSTGKLTEHTPVDEITEDISNISASGEKCAQSISSTSSTVQETEEEGEEDCTAARPMSIQQTRRVFAPAAEADC